MLYYTLIPTSYAVAMTIFKLDGSLVWLSLHAPSTDPLEIKSQVFKELKPNQVKDIYKMPEPVDSSIYPVKEIVQAIDDPMAATSLASSIPVDYNALSPTAADITKKVWDYMKDELAAGRTTSYGEIAKSLGVPNSSRAVARACACNKIAVVIPCHRVLTKEGGLSGYRWGVDFKKELLRREDMVIPSAA